MNQITTPCQQCESLRSELDDWVHTNKIDELQRENGSLRARLASTLHHDDSAKRLAALRALISNDAFAITFQSIGQYRTALLDAARGARTTASSHTSDR